jgi:hypothetical protein
MHFNWHFYLLAGLGMVLLLLTLIVLPAPWHVTVYVTVAFIIVTLSISLLVSYYVYDRSGLYNFTWMESLPIASDATLINIHAGFDETSTILAHKYPHATLQIFDFYNPETHTERSIRIARKTYPTGPHTHQISTTHIPAAPASADVIFNIFSAHEIRDREERIDFLKKQCALLKHGGWCIVMEHLRDIPNFVAYTVGFFHFFSYREWTSSFSRAGLKVESMRKVTPFVSVFVLTKNNGSTP